MRELSMDLLTRLAADAKPPCISLYQPTHRAHPETQQDPIRYRNLLARMEKSLARQVSTREVNELMEPFQALARDSRFWNHRTDGLAILRSPGAFHLFEPQRRMPELLVVADSYHTKPLLRAVQSADRYQILALNLREARLYEGNRYALDAVEMPDVPATLTAALGDRLTDPHLTAASYGGAGNAPAMHHGHGHRKDEVDADRDRFFQVIDRAILEHHSRPTGLPLILAALSEHHTPFRTVSRNPFLLAGGIAANPDALSIEQLRAEAWRVVEPTYLDRLAKLVDAFQVARSREMGAADLAQIAHAVVAGRVGTLLVEDDRQIPGRFDRTSGRIQTGELADPEVDDLLDDLAEAVMQMKGTVVVVPAERMPTDTGAAATFRF